MSPLSNYSAKSDPQEIRRAIAVLFDDTSVVELRVLKAHDGQRFHRTVSGYFDGQHRNALAEAADAWSGLAAGVYATLNPVSPACLARAANRVNGFAEVTTGGADILCRRWLLLDVDAGQPTGVSATDAEHDAAIELARKVREWLTSLGWPEPILTDSGNGAHLLYRIDLPNDAESTALVKAVLIAIDQHFSSPN